MFARPNWYYSGVQLYTQVFDDPTGDDDPDAGAGGSDSGAGGGAEDDLPHDKWTEEQKAEIEKLYQKRIKNIQKKQAQVVADLEKQKNLSSMTEKEKEDLQNKLRDIERATLTKSEIAARERKEAETKHKTELENLLRDRDTWKGKYTDTIIENDLIQAAVASKAHDARQIVKFLRGDSRLVEITEDGQSTGQSETRVSFMGRDKDGKQMKMDLPAVEALSEMEKLPDYANLFVSGLKGGLGKDNPSGQNGPLDAALESQEAYAKRRPDFKKVKTT